MTTFDTVTSMLRHFAPEERSVPDSPTYPGRNAEAIRALNAALQELAAMGPAWRRKRPSGALLHVATQVTATTVAGSTGCVVSGHEAWMDGCRIDIEGSKNRLASQNALVYPAKKTGSFSATAYHDAILLDPDVIAVLGKVELDTGIRLLPTADVDNAATAILKEGDYGRPVTVVDPSDTPGTPRFFSVESAPADSGLFGTASQRYTLRISPPPAFGGVVLQWNETVAVASIQTADFSELPTTPPNFVESILIPIAEFHLMSSPFFRDTHMAAHINAGYQRAIMQAKKMNPAKAGGMKIRAQF